MPFKYKTVMKPDRFGVERPQEVSYWVDDNIINDDGTAFNGNKSVAILLPIVFILFIMMIALQNMMF